MNETARSRIHRILLGIDHCGRAEAAVQVTGELAEALDAEVRVLHVHEAPLSVAVFDPEALERAHVETPAAADALVKRTVERFAERGVRASGWVRMADLPIAQRIVAAAREDQADLVVIGTLGTSRWQEVLAGGTTRAVVQLSPCPVLVVPQASAGADPRRLVLGVDGSSGAERAARVTAALAAQLSGSVMVVHAAEGALGEHGPDAIAAVAATIVGEDRVNAVRVRAHTEGDVAGALRAEAREFGAGMLVVGRRGRSPLGRLLLGGVSERLLHDPPCPLLVVPPDHPRAA